VGDKKEETRSRLREDGNVERKRKPWRSLECL